MRHHFLSLLCWLLCASCLPGSLLSEDSPSRGLRWRALPDLPNPVGVAGPFAGVHDGVLLIAGGANFAPPVWQNDKKWHSEIYVLGLSGRRCRWHVGGRLPRPLAYGSAVSTPDGVVCMGGNDSEKTYRDVFLMSWDAGREQVTMKDYPSLPRPCAFAAATLVGDVIYLVGGQHGQTLDTAMNTLWTLDLSQRDNPEQFQWREEDPCPWPSRALHVTASQSDGQHGCIFVISGRRQEGDEVQFLKDTWKYTPATRRWIRCEDIPRCVMAAPGIGYRTHEVVVLGGADGSYFYRVDELKDKHPGFPLQAWSYDTRHDRWSSAGKTPANQVTTIAVRWKRGIIVPSGEVRPRVRSASLWHVR